MSWPAAPEATVEADLDVRPAVTVLSGFWSAAAIAVARSLLSADPSLILIRHDLSGIRDGLVHRIVLTATGVLEDDTITLVHGCVLCTLREDVLPGLVRLARSHLDRDLVLVLPEVIEPQALADACAVCRVDDVALTETVRIDSFVTVVDAQRVLPDLTTTDDLIHRRMHAADDDHRSVANVVARQIEYADTVVLWGESPTAFDTARLTVLLHHCCTGSRLGRPTSRSGKPPASITPHWTANCAAPAATGPTFQACSRGASRDTPWGCTSRCRIAGWSPPCSEPAGPFIPSVCTMCSSR
jgi:hypothetical protein